MDRLDKTILSRTFCVWFTNVWTQYIYTSDSQTGGRRQLVDCLPWHRNLCKSLYLLLKDDMYWLQQNNNNSGNNLATKKLQHIVRIRYNHPLHSVYELSRYTHNDNVKSNFSPFENVYESGIITERNLTIIGLQRTQNKYLLKRWLKRKKKDTLNNENGKDNDKDEKEKEKDNDEDNNKNQDKDNEQKINTIQNEQEEMNRKKSYLTMESKLHEKKLLKRCMKHSQAKVFACENIIQVKEIMSSQEKLKKSNATDCVSCFAWDLVGINAKTIGRMKQTQQKVGGIGPKRDSGFELEKKKLKKKRSENSDKKIRILNWKKKYCRQNERIYPKKTIV
ncbi:hypothetical protein RFI_32990 [Reticulomyxa filosa]|uniref:Uncharacterized protein n=1 Tax=Reticulomyxa filosa TaxID=46433 RepID=X6LTJ1_RETFI|nr:hypothetical protein RFI_32990 [Reticulomyxa filosa]|eukprot:ETO04407.1 hypothetical protein RFI_32990 [Reticulomyxa filosa]